MLSFLEKNFNIPILFLIFNRPNTTQIVFNEIKKIKPIKLYIAADGPRSDNINDKKLCEETKEIIGQINWECDTHTLFREKNLGCKNAVSSALSWFFENEEMGIILEDDCLPTISFFWFCKELLIKYKDDNRIMMISGMNYFNNMIEMDQSYFFSNYTIVWGWASWRRAWKLYEINMKGWKYFYDNKYINYIYNNKKFIRFALSMFKNTYEKRIDTWDIQWYFSTLINNGLSIIPKYNLVTNIGIEGTHVNEKSKVHFMPTKAINYNNIIHPKFIILDYKYNNLLINKIANGLPNYKTRKIKIFFIRIFRIPKKIFKIFKFRKN